MPKIFEMTKATSENTVAAFIEFELVKLAENVNVSGNLTDAQIQEIAHHLVTTYPNESIGDFKICFSRASKGVYGKIFKLDGIEVGLWVKSYLEEKYAILEANLLKEKEAYNTHPHKTNEDWIQLWKEAIAKPDEEGAYKKQSGNLSCLSFLKGFTDKEIKDEGQEKPKRTAYPSASAEEVVKHALHVEYIKQNYDARTAQKKECWMPENQWLELNT